MDVPVVEFHHRLILLLCWLVLFVSIVICGGCWLPNAISGNSADGTGDLCIFSLQTSTAVLISSVIGIVPLSVAVVSSFAQDREALAFKSQLLRPRNTQADETTPLKYSQRGASLSAASANGEDSGKVAGLAESRVRRSLVFLYIGHFFSSWSDRMWQFLVPVVFMDIFVDTLWPSALFGLSIYSSTVLLMPAMGKYLDKSSRWRSLMTTIVVENVCLVVTTVLLAYLMIISNPSMSGNFWDILFEDSNPQNHDARLLKQVTLADSTATPGPVSWTNEVIAVFVSIILLSIVAEVNNQGQTIAVEKDWVCVLANVLAAGTEVDEAEAGTEAPSPASSASKYGTSQSASGDLTDTLFVLNKTLRRIDLGCKVLAPGAVGLMLQFGSVDNTRAALVSILVVTFWNLISFPIECVCHSLVYHLNREALRLKAHMHENGLVHVHISWEDPNHEHFLSMQGSVTDADASDASLDRQAAESSGPVIHNNSSVCATTFYGFKTYFAHQVFLASLAYALLYLTVLDGGAIVTAYLRWADVSPLAIAVSRGVGAVFGILGTVFAAWLQSLTGSITKSAMISIWIFWILLLPAFLAFLFGGEDARNATAWFTMSSLVFSRLGLWAFDLLENQILQEWVEEQDRGTISSVQVAMSQLAYVAIQVVVLGFSDPSQFSVLVDVSTGVVLCACLSYTVWYFRHDEGAFNVVDETGALKLRVRG